MNDVQAEALSRILAEMATKNDLLVLESSIDNKLLVLENSIEKNLLVLEQRIQAVEKTVDYRIESLKTYLTTRGVAAIVLLGTMMTLVDAFID